MGMNRNIRNHFGISGAVYDAYNENVDYRTACIYEQYRRGYAMTLDDLKYLSKKDPEGCKRILNKFTGNGREEEIQESTKQKEQSVMDHLKKMEYAVYQTQEKMNQLELTNVSTSAVKTLMEVKESLNHLKNLISLMNQEELGDMMNHLYQTSELRTQYDDELLGWEKYLEETDKYYVPFTGSERDYRI